MGTGSTTEQFARKLAGILLLILEAAFLSGCASPCKQFVFHQVEPGVLVGCRPRIKADYETLRREGVRTLLSYESFFWHVAPERRRAHENGMDFRNVPILVSPLGPSEKKVKAALLALRDPGLRPVYIHCLYGRDRTAIVIALYRVYFEGWAPKQAWQEALRSGFKSDVWLRGFERYYWRHTQVPDWAREKRATKQMQ